jgi:hypothetical protein
MAKSKRKLIGSIVKGKAGKPGEPSKPDYIKVRGEHVLKDGQFLNLESKAQQLASLEAAVAAKKLSEEVASGIRERINKIPDFVRFEIIAIEKE